MYIILRQSPGKPAGASHIKGYVIIIGAGIGFAVNAVIDERKHLPFGQVLSFLLFAGLYAATDPFRSMQ